METDRYQFIQHSGYPTIPKVTNILTATFCYCSYTWAVQTIIAVFPVHICYWFRVIRFLFFGGRGAVNLPSYYSDAEGPEDCGTGVFIAEVAGVGDKGSENTSVDAETHLVAFMVDFHT